MATLEDKILGERLHNYCSSSEESDHESSDTETTSKNALTEVPITSSYKANKWEGASTNTGPKGVITDWQKYNEHEREKRIADEKEKIELAKKLTLTVQSALDDEREKALLEDPEMAELLNDEFLISYQKQRMEEMLKQTVHNIKFGELIYLKNGQEFLDAIDKEHKSVTIIIHIYEDNIQACKSMSTSLQFLCKLYDSVKFCCIKGSYAGISRHFKTEGIPALLVYKSGNLVGNFIRVSDELGDNFVYEDVQEYLVEHGLLEDKTCKPEHMK